MVVPEQPLEPGLAPEFACARQGESMTQAFYVGIDVSKSQLDVALGQSTTRSFRNTTAGIDDLIAWLGQQEVARIVIESTGIYSSLAATRLTRAGFAVCVVQPGRIKQFARSQGQLAKTDRIDARIIARFGEASPELVVYQEPRLQQARLRALVDRRDQVVEDRVREEGRLEACQDAIIRKRLETSIKRLRKETVSLEKQIAALVGKDPDLGSSSACLQTQTGVGACTAAVLMAHLPELGRVNRQEIAALAGLAPYNNDSGSRNGKRSIFGGRERARGALYMAAVTAARSDEHLSGFYRKLRAAGKAAKVALIAVARKLIVRLNSLMAQHRASQPSAQATPA